MRTVALISGGKDSCYNMLQCVGAGHTIVALANLQPQNKDELDSYMYQTVGHQGIDLYAEAMGLPLYREVISGVAVDQGRYYNPTENDEVEDLYRLLKRVMDDLDIEAVSCGAILSDYQRVRVENVCQRLGLVSLAYLWRRNQKELLQEMIASGVEAIIIKVAALGLDPKVHLGMTLSDIQPHLLVMQEKYGLNVCGEGGEYETFTLDCPLFRKRLVVDEKELVIHSEDPVASVGYLNLKLHLETKENSGEPTQLPPTIKNSLDFVNDLNDTVFSDISDIELSESELESIEKLEKGGEEELNQLLSYSREGKDISATLDAADDSQIDNMESIEVGYNYDYLCDESLTHPVLDHRSIYGNNHGWYFIGGIVGEGHDTALATEDAMKKLIKLLESEDLQLSAVSSVNIYMRDMAEYAALNAVYVATFRLPNPPTRVCIQCPLPDDVGLIMDAVAHKEDVNRSPEAEGACKERVTMHVQGISHWAPANIGPYSQAVKVGEVVSTSGQIALVPGSMPASKRAPDTRSPLPLPPQHKPQIYNQEGYAGGAGAGAGKRKRRLADKILPQKVRDLVPESQAYMDLLAFERKLDATIHRKRLDIQEALKRPMKQKRKLRIFISNTFYPGQGDNAVASWELRVEGRLLDDSKNDPNKVKRKFSSFFKSLVIELDKELYGPDNHLVEWHRTLTTQETDGFQVKRPGYKNVRCTILLLLDYQPLQFKLDQRLARLLGVHTQARPVIVNALWQYVKTHRLQDPHEREYIACDKYLEQIFGCARVKLAEVPARLGALLHAPDPIVINHVIAVEPPHDAKQTACYDIDVEVDDTLKTQMNSFLLSTANQQEIQGLDAKIHETVDTINQLKTNREFFLSFSKEPQQFIQKWLVSQSRDLKTLAGGAGNPEEERRGAFYAQPWAGEGVARYLHARLAARRRDLDLAVPHAHAHPHPHPHLARL